MTRITISGLGRTVTGVASCTDPQPGANIIAILCFVSSREILSSQLGERLPPLVAFQLYPDKRKD